MKKFFVGLLSMFLVLGAGVLTACGSDRVEMTLSSDTVSVQIKDENVSPEQVVTVTVTGTDDTSISASAFGYENIIDVRVEPSTEGRNLVYITGKDTEGRAEVIVRSHEGNASQVISVDVYSEVSAMEQKIEESAKKQNFALRGGSVELIEDNLITFSPSQNSRRVITWSLADPSVSASVEGSTLNIDPSFTQDTITLIATTEKGISCEITLDVIDILEQDLSLSWSYSRDNQEYIPITSENNTFNIVPNLANDENYTGYIKLNFSQDLDVTYSVTKNGQPSDDVIVERRGQDNDGNPIYAVFTNSNRTNLNDDYVVSFSIGYRDYDYSLSTLETLPINIRVREKVNNIVISNSTSENIAGSTQVLYSEYLNGHGAQYNVQVLPTTVVDSTNRYSISVEIDTFDIPAGGISDGCPVEFYYQDVNNNNRWTQIRLDYDATTGVYSTGENNSVSVNTIYMKAPADLRVVNFDDIVVTFTSVDNPNISNVFNARLVKSVSAEDFVFENADFRVDSSMSTSDITITKTFTLQGQTTIDGLYVLTNSNHVDITQPVRLSSDDNSVTFSITLTLRRASHGVTALDSYQICHENGLQSEVFDIDIFLPLKDGAVVYDTANTSNSVTHMETNNLSYTENGEVVSSELNGLSSLMLKNGTTTPVLYMFNTSGIYSAQANIDISYFDFVESDTMTLERFRGLINSQEGIREILSAARANTTKSSDIAYFTSNNSSIITSSTGFTYAVVTFTGKGAEGDADINGNKTIIKIILIESYVSPDGLSVSPLSDRQVSLYAADTISSERDGNLARKRITINFVNTGITYKNIDNFDFVSTTVDSSGNPIMTGKFVSDNGVTWQNGRYSIDNITITDSYMTFDIVTNSNFGAFSFYDELEVHYQLYIEGENGTQVMDIVWTTINITIRNAERVTNLTWENSDDDGIYFELGDREPYYLVLSSSPVSARNSNISYLITDDNGGVIDNNTFVSVDNQISSNTLGINLSDSITSGRIGYIYLLPEDAIYENSITYNYYDDNQNIMQNSISVNALGRIRGDGQTWYDYLVGNAFFQSNTSPNSQADLVSFADILLKIKITVADGSSFDYAYRIYDENDFNGIIPNLYYTVMNSLELSADRMAITSFSGGLQGYDETITITFNGANFASEIAQGGEVRNITFSGQVTGQGFVADINNGSLNNVTVDVYQTYSSTLTSTLGYVGGLVGTNYGLISNSAVLGLTITASNATVGGIAGQNNGTIEYARVEFYNLSDRENIDNTLYSSFTGLTIGGIVGEATTGSIIDHSFAYNYNIDEFTNTRTTVFRNYSYAGAIIGRLSGQSRVSYSFGVIDNISAVFATAVDENSTLSADSEYYVSYYDGNDSYQSTFSNPNSSNLITRGEGFYSYVNGGNAHFRDLYQDEKVTDVTGNFIHTTTYNGYYQSLETSDSQGILFYYQINRGTIDLTSSELNDLNALNTTDLASLLASSISENIIVTSSNSSIVRTIGSTLNISGTGDLILRISSKHDVNNTKEIAIKVVNGLSKMLISYTDSTNNSFEVGDDSTTYLQRTKSRDYTVTYENTQVILGNSANRYDLVQNNIDLQISLEGENPSTVDKISNNLFKVTANRDSENTNLTIRPVIFEDETYQQAVNDEFARNFTVVAVDGVISFYYTGESLPITPSTNAAIRVEVNTTSQDDGRLVTPVISYNGDRLTGEIDEELSMEGSTTVINYRLPQEGQDYILSASITLQNSSFDSYTGVYSYIFEVSFSVHQSYKSKVDEDMTFEVSFVSQSGSESGDSAGVVELNLTKQNINNIDVTTYRITNSYWMANNGGYVTAHERGEQTGVLAPGSSAILQVVVNPYFAHYDYMTLSYSGSNVANAILLEGVTPSARENVYIQNTNGDYYQQADSIRFVPADDSRERQEGILYFRVAVSSTVNADSLIRFTATFYESEGSVIDSVNSYLTINYLSEPRILVDGASTAYLALGSTVNVQIQVLEDQNVDSVNLEGDNLQGISLSPLGDYTIDQITGIKTYNLTISASILASLDAANNAFFIQAQVSRTLNGARETKTTQATVVLVDFKLDQNNITIEGAEDSQLSVWLGVNQPFSVAYNLLPTEYNYDRNDQASVNKVQELLNARNEFLKNETYLSRKGDDGAIQYGINYTRNFDEALTLSDRLYYIVDGQEISVNDSYRSQAGVQFNFIDNTDGSQEAIITGTRIGVTENFVLKTYITLGDGSEPAVINTYFSVTVDPFSSEDLPLTISNATEFKNLNPDSFTSSDLPDANDFILTNDIVLEDYTPFSTSLISSLDGNGYTIYIKSFSEEALSGSTLNLALFNNVNEDTTLKNVRVNVYNGGQLTVDLAQLTSSARINIAGLAITNAGTITNCEVVSFYTDSTAIGDVDGLNVSATTRHSNPSGFNVSFIRGANTTQNEYVTQNSTWIPSIAGFVINNDGSITNSRVGGDQITILGSERTLSDGSASGLTYASTLSLDTFYIIGQGDMAGFVLNNTGTVSASFVKQIDMENQSNTTSYNVSGFANSNSGKIITSYIEGVENDPGLAEDTEYSIYAYEGSSLKSRLGCISGFINTNTGTIQDSYSNILIANSSDNSRVYLASGFVYKNSGTIETSYSASQIANSRSTQMNFSGVDESGNLLATGTYINCYFFNKERYNSTDSTDTSESQYATGAIIVLDPSVSSNFYGFAIADGEEDGIWRISDEEGIKLIEPDLQSYSHRYISYLPEDSDYEGVTGEDDQGRYFLPYATLQFTDSYREINTALGSIYNPIIIENAQDFIEISGLSESRYVQEYFNNDAIFGTYRLAHDIDLSEISESITLPSTTKAFAGRLYGNGFSITNLSIASESTNEVSYGLFASIESRAGSEPLISNVNIGINQVIAGGVPMVGGLAGYIKDAIIVNIELTFADNARVVGLNFAGGLSGLTFGDTTIKNVVVTDPYVVADRYDVSLTDDYFDVEKLNNTRNDIRNNLNYNTSTNSSLITSLENYSYAGSVVGFVDHFTTATRSFDVSRAEDYSINNIRVSGTVYVQGQVVGGVFGLTSFQTNVRDAGITITGPMASNESHIIATKYFAGGVVGQSFGALSRIFAVYDQATQDAIENGMSNFYGGNTETERGALDIFNLSSSDYSQVFIGGLIGYAGSGLLEISYSKINVTSESAQYAGGVIGGIDLTTASSYFKGTDLFAEGTNTKYFINEVFATGDVRATSEGTVANAGGIIGASIGTNNRIAMLAVNAVNYISNYNYATGEYNQMTDSYNISRAYKTNLLLGSAFADTDSFNNDQTQTVDINNYSQYLNLIQLQGTQEAEGSSTATPTVAYYESYAFNGFRATMNLFGSVSAEISTDIDSSLYARNVVYAIESPIGYTSASVGHSSTQQAFLSSGTWETANWQHPDADLFPSIRYQRSSSYIYLDAYEESIRTAFNMMRTANSDVTIVVRGRTSPDSEDSYSNVDLRPYWNELQNMLVSGYSGSLIGSNEYIVTSGDGVGDRVRIISPTSFIENLGSGFYLNNVIIEYATTSDNITLNPSTGFNTVGLFSKGGINEATISNLQVIVSNPISVDANDDIASFEFGLIAPTISSSTLSNISVEVPNTVGQGTSLVNISLPANDCDDVYVGMFAGQLTQNSRVSILQVNGLSFTAAADLFTINGNGRTVTNLHVGGYFGKISKAEDALDARMNIAGITSTATDQDTDNQAINILSMTVANAYLGGYVGLNEGLNYIGTFQDGSINTNIDIKLGRLNNGVVSNAVSVTNLYGGLIFGKTTSNINNVNLAGATISGGLYIANTESSSAVTHLYAGGFAGSISSQITLRNIGTMNFEVATTSACGQLDKDTFVTSTKNYPSYMVNVSNIANVGALIGDTSARVSIVGGTSSFGQLNSNGESLRVTGTTLAEINIGSVIGRTTAVVSEQDAYSLSITGNIVSNAQIVVSSANTNAVNVGGIVGAIYGNSSTDENAPLSRTMIGSDNNSTVNFIGAVYSSAQNINFGGIVGFASLANSSESLSISRGVFGGALKIFGTNTTNAEVDVNAGGSIGSLESNNADSTITYNVSLENNFNYGDVFVEYDRNLKTVASYNFGGLIANVANSFIVEANYNYSMVTSHNSRYVENNDNTNRALFGNDLNPSSTIDNNYYSSFVSLCHDEYGIDVGYSSSMLDGYGYRSKKGESVSEIPSPTGNTYGNLLTVFENSNIYEMVSNTDLPQGHKLNPISLSSIDIEIENIAKTNGLTYYTVDINDRSFNLNLDTFSYIGTMTGNNKVLDSVAIIGDAKTINYTLDSNTTDSHASFINTLSGQSFVSGLVMNLNVDTDNEQGLSAFGGLVGTMNDNAVVYAVQVQGTLDVGGTVAVNVGGIVGNMTSGKISESSTVLDIVYRGNTATSGNTTTYANVSGIANMPNTNNNSANNKYIVNTYSTGSITSYISANLYAFASGEKDYSSVVNSYSISKLDQNDYTTSGDPQGTLSVFGNTTVTSSYYDKNAINTSLTVEDEEETETNTSEKVTSDFNDLVKTPSADETTVDYLSSYYYDAHDYDFNYGYPTLKFGFMKTSSYATAGETTRGDSCTYDYYVTESEYTRLANNNTPDDLTSGDYYFIIPNAGVLAKIDNISREVIVEITEGDTTTQETTTVYARNFVLWYDIDIAQSQYADSWVSIDLPSAGSSDDPNVETTYDVIKDFDGLDHTISNLKNSLFNNLGAVTEDKVTDKYLTTIRNIRITDSVVSGKGVLANTIYNSDISNMTVSGTTTTAVKYDGDTAGWQQGDYYALGGLANRSFNSTISTLTNLVQVTTNESKDPQYDLIVGGIIGRSASTNYYYVSNYGPVNANIAQQPSTYDAVYVGGIAGATAGNSSTISHSYNATSVLAGYATSTNLSTVKANYRVGGLVGYSAINGDNIGLDIVDSYNSGAIKSGNKSNGDTKADGGTNGYSYAGGIIAQAEIAEITSCYNEGTVEALGSSPTFEFRWQSLEVVERNLAMFQTSAQNVWAYGIGYLSNGTLTDCVVKNVDNSVVANGSLLGRDNEVKRWYLNESRSCAYENSLSYQVRDSVINDSVTSLKVTAEHGWLNEYRDVIRARFSISSTVQVTKEIPKGFYIGSEDDDYLSDIYSEEFDVAYVNAYDSFGIPSNIIIPLYIRSTLQYEYYRASKGWGTAPPGYNDDEFSWSSSLIGETNGAGEDSYIFYFVNTDFADVDFSYNDYTSNYISGFISNRDDSGTSDITADTIKANTRSNKKVDLSDLTFTVAGENYYRADSDNVNSIFQSGIYQYEIEASLADLNIPYINNLSYYSVSTGNTGANVIARVSGIDENNLYITCYSESQLSSIRYTVNFNYTQSITLDTSGIEYYYVDDYSFGIGGVNLNSIVPLVDYSISAPNGTSYTSVVKAYREGQFEEAPEVVDSDLNNTDDFVYFAYENGLLIYIPNARLTIEGLGSTTVNDETLIGGTLASNLEENLTNIINSKFNGVNYYLSISSSTTREKEIEFSSLNGSGSENDIVADLSQNGNSQISVGEVLSTTIYGNISIENNNSYLSQINIDLSNIFDFSGQDYTSYSLVNRTATGDQTLANFTDGSGWTVLSNTDIITISDNQYQYTLTRFGNNLRLNFADLAMDSSTVATLASALQSYIQTNYVIVATDSTGLVESTIDSYININSNPSTSIENANHTITIDLNTLSQDALALSNNNAILSYDHETSTWDIADGLVVNINGHQLNATISDNELKLTNTESSLNITAADVRNYLSSLTLITNDFSTSLTLEDVFAQYVTGIKEIEITNYDGEVIGTLSYFQAYNKTYSSTAAGITINGNIATLNSGNLSAFSSLRYTLNGVTIYYGNYQFEFREDFTSSFSSINLTLNMGDTQEAVYDYSFSSNATTTANQQLTAIATNTGGYYTSYGFNSFENVEGYVDISVNVYPTYKIAVDDVMDTVGVTLEREDNNGSGITSIFAEGTIIEDEESSTLSISTNLIRFKVDDNIVGYQITVDESNKLLGYRFFDEHDSTILMYGQLGGRKLYRIFYDANGEAYDNPPELESGELDWDSIPESEFGRYGLYKSLVGINSIYTTIEEKVGLTTRNVSIPVNKLLDSSYNPFFTDEEYLNIFNLFDNGEDRYIYIKGFEYTANPLESELNSFKTYITGVNYVWSNGRYIRSYQPVETIVNEGEGFNTTLTYSYAEVGDNSSFIKNQHYTLTDGTFKILLNNTSNKINSVTIENSSNIVSAPITHVPSTVEARPACTIVLTRDISFVDINGGFVKAEGVNIIGNGYYISYYNSPFFIGLNGDGQNNTFVKDVLFLSESQNNAMIANIGFFSEYQTDFKNIALYGSSESPLILSSISSIIDTNIYVRTSNTTMDIINYASIVKSFNNINYSSPYSDLTLFDNRAVKVTITNNGFIMAANGKDGTNGNDGTSISLNGSDGRDGDQGGDVIISQNDASTFNEDSSTGIIKTGDGGNGGAGGNGHKAPDNIVSSGKLSEKYVVGSPGSGGTGGNVGNIILGENSENCSLSRLGINGLGGATGRASLGGITFISGHIKDPIAGTLIGSVRFINGDIYDLHTSYDENYDSTINYFPKIGISGSGFIYYTLLDNITLNNVFAATGENDAQFPTDWVSKTYDQLVKDANGIIEV